MKTSIFTVCEVALKGFQIALSIFFFPAYIKITIAGEKKPERLRCPFAGFQLLLFL